MFPLVCIELLYSNASTSARGERCIFLLKVHGLNCIPMYCIMQCTKVYIKNSFLTSMSSWKSLGIVSSCKPTVVLRCINYSEAIFSDTWYTSTVSSNSVKLLICDNRPVIIVYYQCKTVIYLNMYPLWSKQLGVRWKIYLFGLVLFRRLRKYWSCITILCKKRLVYYRYSFLWIWVCIVWSPKLTS